MPLSLQLQADKTSKMTNSCKTKKSKNHLSQNELVLITTFIFSLYFIKIKTITQFIQSSIQTDATSFSISSTGGLSIHKCRQISSIQFSLLFYYSFTCCKILNKQIIMGYSFLFKYILIGDQSVGKSCILLHFTEKNFQIESNPTIGVEFGSKNIQIKDKEVKLQIWDTAGQQVYKSITRSYYRGTIGAILVYDITNRKSFDNILKWVQELKTYAMNDKVTILMVGNKEDLSQSRQVSYEQANALAQKLGMKFIESSAKTGLNIQHIFQSLTQFIVERIQKGEINTNDESIGVKVGERQTMRLQKNSKRCCY